MKGQIDTLAASKVELEKSKEILEKNIRKEKNDHMALKEAHTSNEEYTKNSTEVVETLKRTVSSERVRAHKLSSELEAKENHVTTLETHNRELLEELENLRHSSENKLLDAASRTKVLQLEIESSKRDKAEIERSCANSKEQVRRTGDLKGELDELRRHSRSISRELDVLAQQVDEYSSNAQTAERRIEQLKTQIREEKDCFVSELKPLLGLTLDHTGPTLQRLGISLALATVSASPTPQWSLDLASTIGGRRFTIFGSTDPLTPCSTYTTFDDNFEWYFRGICQRVIRTWVCVDGKVASNNVVSFLWDLWANLKSVKLADSQVSRIGNLLASMLNRLFSENFKGNLPELAVWLTSQLVGYLSRWQFTGLELELPGFISQPEQTNGPLSEAGRWLIKQCLDFREGSGGYVPGPFQALLSPIAQHPDACLQFPAQFEGKGARVCVYHFVEDAESLWAIERGDGSCLFWHGSSTLCNIIHRGYDLWLRLTREETGKMVFLLPREDVEEWMMRKFELVAE